jgi:hypothetical protein
MGALTTFGEEHVAEVDTRVAAVLHPRRAAQGGQGGRGAHAEEASTPPERVSITCCNVQPVWMALNSASEIVGGFVGGGGGAVVVVVVAWDDDGSGAAFGTEKRTLFSAGWLASGA